MTTIDLPGIDHVQASVRVLAARHARAMLFMCPSNSERGREGRVLGHTHGPPASKKAGGSHHRLAAHPAFPAPWLERLIRTLPGDRAFLPPSRADHHHRPLDLSVGRPGPYDFAVHDRSFVHAPASSKTRARAVSRRIHRIPPSTSVTTAKRPSHEDGMRALFLIFENKASGKFRCNNLD